jgi:hypothetical protein
MNRKTKLEKIRQKKAVEKSVKIPEVIIDPVRIGLEAEELRQSIDNLKEALGVPVEFKDLDSLIAQLAEVGNLSKEVRDFKIALANFKHPKSLNINGLDELLKQYKDYKPIVKVDASVARYELAAMAVSIQKLALAIKANTADPQSQDAADYIPMRRVIKLGPPGGGKFIFDDLPMGMGGGGGGRTRRPTIFFAPIAQSGAGTTTLVAGQAGLKIRITSYVVELSAAGTFKFQSDNTDLSGAMSFSTDAGASSVGGEFSAILGCEAGESFKIVTTLAPANGHLSYYLEVV